MSITTQSGWNVSDLPPFPVRKFSVEEYHRMIDAGLLTENDPVALLAGWIVPKMPRATHLTMLQSTNPRK